ncbi:MAG: CBS domain-containing protein [Rhizobiaceae bacterium]|nr:CBS domain-containing protein [Rhizobiaceae bacterium]MCV0408627.1 CBS domain-containing protein [Rhizobiaceae bacterium]
MTVKSILDEKGRDVMTIAPDQTLAEAASILAQHRIGAVVVTRGDRKIAGILSERDIVRAVGESGSDALQHTVADLMTAKVQVCREHHTVNQVMEMMTRGRFRHLPVEENGKLDGIVSIGDVVKRRILEVEREAEEIKQYIATA